MVLSLADTRYRRRVSAPEFITCVDCGGRCSPISFEPETGWQPGDIVAYRCADCLDRWDIELLADDLDQRPDI